MSGSREIYRVIPTSRRSDSYYSKPPSNSRLLKVKTVFPVTDTEARGEWGVVLLVDEFQKRAGLLLRT